MALPTYDSDQLRALARVLARTALDELIREMTKPTKTNGATPDQGERAVHGDFDGADGTRSISR
jgi:hypothetical protein